MMAQEVTCLYVLSKVKNDYIGVKFELNEQTETSSV